jgi:hypothetical protein
MARGRFTRRPTPNPAPMHERRPIVSSAAHITREQFRTAFKPAPNAADCWKYYGSCGVVRFGVDWLASACSRARLYIGRVDPDGAADPEPVEDARTQAVMAAFAGGQSGQAQIVQRVITHLSVVGETYLIHLTKPDDVWVAATSEEVEKYGNETRFLIDDRTKVTLDPDVNDVLRVWRPHPVRAWEPISPISGLLPECAQLCALNAHVLASADSRLAGAGILTVPESATIASPSQSDRPQLLDDPFMNAFVENMMRPLEDRSSAAAVVPIVIRVPDESVNGIKHIETATPFDAQVPELIDAATKKIALGMDAPPEIILGIGETNHWNAEAIDAQGVRVHVEPNLAILTDALTRKWLPGALQDAGLPADPNLVVFADVSDLTQEPDRTDTALKLYELGVITAEAVVRAAGFNETDVATAPAPPAGNNDQDQTEAEQPAVPATPARPQLVSAGAHEAPRWGVDHCELAVLRALELAGKRMLNPTLRGRHRGVAPWDLHTKIRASVADLDRLMDGAWDPLAALDAPPPLIAALDTYTRGLLTTGVAHHNRLLVGALTGAA